MSSEEQTIEQYKKQVAVLEQRLQFYEQDGAAKLYYALSRKMVEMADLLNNTKLNSIPLDDPKDKTFDRLKILWNDSAGIAAAVKTLGESVGITGDESKDVKKKHIRTTPESIADVLSNSNGQSD